jgi:hypothetical protein
MDDVKTAKERRADDRAAAKEEKELAAADADAERAATESRDAEVVVAAAAAEHLAELERDAAAEKANIDEHAAGARADIDNAAADARAEVDAKVDEARPEEEKVTPEHKHFLYMQELRDIRAKAMQASRHMDHFAMGQAVHDLADLLHRFFEEHRPPPDPLGERARRAS